jgi:rhodanese-related sulfurtransferase
MASACYCKAQNNFSLAPDDFKNQITQSNIQILDVRTAGEYQSGHIQKSFLADWNNQEQFMDRVKYLEKTKPVYVYCLSGGRSAAAAKWMRANGFAAVYELQGGIKAWKTASLPLEGVADIKQMTRDEFQLKTSGAGYILVEFGAEWCPPCKKMEPVVEQLQKDMGPKLKFVKMDGGVHTNVMKELNIENLPSFIIYKNGKEIWRKQGMTELAEFKKQISSN